MIDTVMCIVIIQSELSPAISSLASQKCERHEYCRTPATKLSATDASQLVQLNQYGRVSRITRKNGLDILGVYSYRNEQAYVCIVSFTEQKVTT